MARLARSGPTWGLLVVLLVLASCAGGGPRIREQRSWAGSGIPEWPAGQPYPLVRTVNMCLDRPGSVEITGVAMKYSEGGLRVDAFSVRPWTPPAGQTYPEPESFTEAIWELGFDPGSVTVDMVCPELSDSHSTGKASAGYSELGLQLSKPTDDTARGAVIEVAYRSGGQTYVHQIGFEIILCEGDHVTEEIAECDFRDYEW